MTKENGAQADIPSKEHIIEQLTDYRTVKASLRKIIIVFFLSVAIDAYLILVNSVLDIPMMIFTLVMGGYVLLLNHRKKATEKRLDSVCLRLFERFFNTSQTMLNDYLIESERPEIEE
ncbi:Uncharacterised protein [Leminorella richardii]|uniref:Uncharacterized protein n=1 Tax=Leminorella richardii TaxID=158841 RepID=A0A2X4V6M5_9GAMM|nr:hypothetical protein [Leminorella richardii]SQI40930.1 Uncharacterised protein [Leminorella richardii]